MNIKKYVRQFVALSLGLLSVSLTAVAETVSYIDATGATMSAEATPVASSSSAVTWNAGWYVVNADVAIAERITVSGDVHLILADGGKLTASKGINVSDGNSFTIYGQSGGTGELEAIGTDYDASIGGNGGANGGDSHHSKGGDGGNGAKSGAITINGGTIAAQNGIGGGHGGNGGPSHDGKGGTGGIGGDSAVITINGGTVVAQNGIGGGHGGNGGYGFLGGNGGAGGSAAEILIQGGSVYVSGQGIGVGPGGSGGGTNSMDETHGGSDGAAGTGGTFKAEGDAFIVASAISDNDDKTAWEGVIFEGDAGTMYGDVTLTEDAEIPSGKTLTIGAGQCQVTPLSLHFILD